jgi:hypothetical protein
MQFFQHSITSFLFGPQDAYEVFEFLIILLFFQIPRIIFKVLNFEFIISSQRSSYLYFA